MKHHRANLALGLRNAWDGLRWLRWLVPGVELSPQLPASAMKGARPSKLTWFMRSRKPDYKEWFTIGLCLAAMETWKRIKHPLQFGHHLPGFDSVFKWNLWQSLSGLWICTLRTAGFRTVWNTAVEGSGMKNYMGHLAFSLNTDVISYLEIIGSDPNFEAPFQFIGAKTGRQIDTEGLTELRVWICSERNAQSLWLSLIWLYPLRDSFVFSAQFYCSFLPTFKSQCTFRKKRKPKVITWGPQRPYLYIRSNISYLPMLFTSK